MLYIVGTPIGNIEDCSFRQARILSEVEIILTEDTRTTGTFLQRISAESGRTFPSSQRLVSYYKENEFEKLPEILDWIEEGKEIALISEAGMPLVSDPGYLLVKTLVKRNTPFIVIPGPTAATTSLVYSGFNPGEHAFLGFLPKRTAAVLSILKKIKATKAQFPDMSFIFYESPNRIHETLKLLSENYPEFQISIGRELTKKFEEVIRGTAEELLKREYKGELTVVIG